ncbi:MAG: tyrosine-type recombinase/integrase, partial [Silvibacterium sp.]
MNLSRAIDFYVQRKRLTGLLFGDGERILRSFSKAVNDPPLEKVTTDHIQKFLDRSHGCASTYRNNHGRLREFSEYWSRRGEMPFPTLPPTRPAEPQTFVPHIYTKAQVRSLLAYTKISQKHPVCVIGAATLRMFILTLYATGARYSEVRNIKCEDVDLKRSRMTLRGAAQRSLRCIPIGIDLKRELQAYLKSGHHSIRRKGLTFLTKVGEPIARQTLVAAFHRLLRVAEVAREGNSTPKPRFKDFRPTFAVHRITSWIKAGADLNRLLPALATYMGNVSLQSADRYLSLAPERFRK